MKSKVAKFFERLFNSNRFLFIFSVVLAIFIWAAVKINFSDNVIRTVTDVEVNLSSITENSDLVAFAQDGELSVDVDISGKSYDVNANTFTKDDIIIEASGGYIDSAGYRVLNLSGRTQDSDISVVNIEPSTITVFFDRRSTGFFNVEARLTNDLSELVEEGYIAGEPVASLSTVEVSGPATVVEQISKVYFDATFDENNLPLVETREITADISYEIENNRGVDFLVCEGIVNNANTATVTVPVSRTATVPTAVKFVNQPSYYEENPPRVKIKPAKVDIAYSTTDETEYTSYNITTINFRQLRPGENVLTVTPDENTAVTLLDSSVTRFTVEIDIDSQSTIELDASEAKVVTLNQADGFSYEVSLAQSGLSGLTVVGPQELLEGITAENIQVEINVSSIDTERTSWQEVEISNISIQDKNAQRRCWIYGSYTAMVRARAD